MPHSDEMAYIGTKKWLLYVMHIIPNAEESEGGQVSQLEEDKYLFEYAREELTEIAQKDQPFAFTMLTVDCLA